MLSGKIIIQFRIGGTHNTEYSDGKFSISPALYTPIFLLSKLYRPKSQNTAQVSVLTSWHDSIFLELLKLFQYETYINRAYAAGLLPVTNKTFMQ